MRGNAAERESGEFTVLRPWGYPALPENQTFGTSAGNYAAVSGPARMDANRRALSF